MEFWTHRRCSVFRFSVLPRGAQLLQMRKRYCTATLDQGSKEDLLLRLVHTHMLFSQACANFSVNDGISAKDRHVWHEQLKQSSFTGTSDSLQQSSAKHTFHSTGLRSQCEEGLSGRRVTGWELQCFAYLMLIPLWVLISFSPCGGSRTHWQVIPSSLQCNLKETLWLVVLKETQLDVLRP